MPEIRPVHRNVYATALNKCQGTIADQKRIIKRLVKAQDDLYERAIIPEVMAILFIRSDLPYNTIIETFPHLIKTYDFDENMYINHQKMFTQINAALAKNHGYYLSVKGE